MNSSVIFFRLPFGEKIFTVEEQTGASALQFVSFDNENMIDFEGKITEIMRNSLLENEIFSDELSGTRENFTAENEEEYSEKLNRVISFIKEHQLKKLVISRVLEVDYNSTSKSGKLNLTKTFLNLCDAYQNAFTYFFIKEGICWMGAFSELLGKFHHGGSSFETMALAGTLPVEETWTEKEVQEQQPVSDFITSVLKKISDSVQVSETSDHISGNIKHLRTDFRAEIKPENLNEIISELHPTPAVCGIPTKFCTAAIKDFENHEREFYAGYIKVNLPETTEYYVNLRCAQFFQNSVLIYAGGGITADSSAAKEWRETELKSQAITRNLSY